MNKHIKKISIFLVITLSVLGFFVYDNWKYSKVSNAIELNEVISLSSTYNENGEIIEVNSSDNEAAVMINNKLVIVPNDKFLEIVSKYKSKKSKIRYFPYETEKIVVMFTIFQNKEHRSFLLGDFNIWFKSDSEVGNEIIDGDLLLNEILELAGQE